MFRQHIVFLTGAGVSAESGIPTFRGAGGFWNDEKVEALSTAARFDEDPAAALDFYNNFRQLVFRARPNAAHTSIAALEQWHDVTVITQNVDDLHERAGSSHVIHLHGSLTQVTSSLNRLDPKCIKGYPLDVPIKVGDKADDESQMRPAVVMFDEYVDGTLAARIARTADIFVVVGTSLTLYGSRSIAQCPRKDIPRYVIDPEDIRSRLPEGFIWFQATATEGMISFIEEVRTGFRLFGG